METMPSRPLTYEEIVELNYSLQLPPQVQGETLFNQALGHINNTIPFKAPYPNPSANEPILPNVWADAELIMQRCAEVLCKINDHTTSNQVYLRKNKRFFQIISLEPNRDSIWTKVFRTVHLHGTKPVISLDWVAISSPPVRTFNPIPDLDTIPHNPVDIGCPSDDTLYHRIAEIGPPPQPDPDWIRSHDFLENNLV